MCVSNIATLNKQQVLSFSFSMHMCMLSRVQLLAILWTVALQAPQSIGFLRQKYWCGLPLSPPGDLLNPGIELESPESPALAGRFFTTEPSGRPSVSKRKIKTQKSFKRQGPAPTLPCFCQQGEGQCWAKTSTGSALLLNSLGSLSQCLSRRCKNPAGSSPLYPGRSLPFQRSGPGTLHCFLQRIQ